MSYDKEKLIELISAYLDNELTPDEIVEVQELLSTNVEAQEIHTQLSQTANLFKSIDPVAPPAYLKQKIIRRINIQNRTSFLQRIKDKVSARKYNFPVLTYASASLILIFFIVYPITLMLEWPIDKLADVPFIAENDPYEFSRQDDMLEMYADAPELEEFDNDQSKMDEAPNGRFEKGEGNTRADKETIPEHSFAFNEKVKEHWGRLKSQNQVV